MGTERAEVQAAVLHSMSCCRCHYSHHCLLTTALALPAADGNEGGRHHLITASVGNGQLYVMKVQIGDKRWFKGAKKDAEGAWNSFTVA